jgi:enterochelin esterase-like enzyme
LTFAIFAVGCSSVELPQSADSFSDARAPFAPALSDSPCALNDIPPGVAYPPPPAPTPAAAVELAPVSGRGQLIETKFHSALLNEEMPILIYLPPGYFDSARRYPVLYMLAGFVGDHREWVYWGLCDAAETFIRSGHIQPLIIVMPGGNRSYWFNHAPAPPSDGKPYGDYVWKDVLGYADANFRTLPRRASRAIGGLSAGGQAAFMLALTQPQVFSIVGGHSLSLRGADGSLPIFGDAEYFKQYDPLWLIENRDTVKQLTIWLDVGADDAQWGESVRDFHARLDARNVPHAWTDTWRGSHDNAYWSAHVGDYLRWYASQLAGE